MLGSLPILGQPNPSEPKDLHLVGRYALGVNWADNHNSIYPFDWLRRACGCGGCEGLTLGPTMIWPRGFTRTPEGVQVAWADGHASLYPYPSLRAHCRCAGCTGGH